MVDSTGLVVAKYDYYPYGGLRASTVTTDTKVRFTGKYYDGEDVSQYYFGARYLNGLTNRFNSVDPEKERYARWSPYVYVKCNPVSNIDPDGRDVLQFGAGIGIGVWEAVRSNAEGMTNMAIAAVNPVAGAQMNIATGAGIATMIQDPKGTASAAWNQLSSTWMSGHQGQGKIIGRGLAEIGIAVALSKGAGALGKIGSTAPAVESSIQRAGCLGRAGEEAVGVAGAITRIQIPGTDRLRVPDRLTESTLTEVKNVGKLSYGQQLRDYSAYTESRNMSFELWVRPDTRLSGPLNEAISRGAISLRYIP